MIKINLDEILARIADIEGIKFTDTELGIVLGKQRSTVSSWRGRGSIPYADIIEYCAKKNVSLDTVFFNKTTNTISIDIMAAIMKEKQAHALKPAKLKKVVELVASKWPVNQKEIKTIIELAI